MIAATIIAEIGADTSAFVNAAHLASWATMCPGNHESAGRQRGGKTRNGNVHLKTALVVAGNAAGNTKGTYLADKYRRLKKPPWRLAGGRRHWSQDTRRICSPLAATTLTLGMPISTTSTHTAAPGYDVHISQQAA